MASISLETMKVYLFKSISSMNRNKLNGLLAEIDFRNHLERLGFGDRVSMGGWIARCEGSGRFGHSTVAIFPRIIVPDKDYSQESNFPNPPYGLHSICSALHQIGISSYFCIPRIKIQNDPLAIEWYAIQLGLPTQQNYSKFPYNLTGFNKRERRYTFLRYHTDISDVPVDSVPEEFSKEHLRVSFQSLYLSEISDIDGILYGQQFTYPLEIKEKTKAYDKKMGDYFGLDLGPFVKLAFYASKRGNLHSIFIVREIDDITGRNLINWWFITFDKLAQFASWVPVGGGTNMGGGRSTTVRIPKAEFSELNPQNLSSL
jgi:hypothetical protein